MNDGGTLTSVVSNRSAPNALLAKTTEAVVGGGLRSATVSKTVQGNIAKMSLAFDLATSGFCARGASGVTYVGLVANGGTGTQAAALLSTKSGPKVLIKDPAESYRVLADFPNTRPWTRVTLEARNGQLFVEYDGEVAAPPIAFSLTSTSIDVTFGLAASGEVDACDATFDSIVLRLAP